MHLQLYGHNISILAISNQSHEATPLHLSFLQACTLFTTLSASAVSPYPLPSPSPDKNLCSLPPEPILPSILRLLPILSFLGTLVKVFISEKETVLDVAFQILECLVLLLIPRISAGKNLFASLYRTRFFWYYVRILLHASKCSFSVPTQNVVPLVSKMFVDILRVNS